MLGCCEGRKRNFSEGFFRGWGADTPAHPQHLLRHFSLGQAQPTLLVLLMENVGRSKAGFITLTLSGNAPLTSPGPQAPRHLSWVVWISSQQWPHLAYPPPGGPGMDSGEPKVMAEGFRQTHSLFSVQSSQMESAPSTIWIQNGADRSAQNAGCNLEHSSKGTVPSENSHSHRNGQYFQKTSAVMWPRQQEAECSPPPQAFSKQTRVCFYLRPPYTVEKMQNELCTRREAWQ